MSTEEYTGIQKAAILLIALGPEKSANIFKHLKEEEIEDILSNHPEWRLETIEAYEDIELY